MAIYHCSIKIGSRSKGQSAIAASAYRAGTKMTDEQTGLTSDYTKKSGVVFSEVLLCVNAPAEYADREKLWNAVHKIEKAKNAQLWREIEVALPREFSREEQIATVREYVKGLTTRGMCADWSLHDKGDGNPHAHIMLTTRPIEIDGTWAKLKEKKEYALDEHGERIPLIDETTGEQKIDSRNRKQWKRVTVTANEWNSRDCAEQWRSEWTECCNRRLPEQNRIDHRSYARQGVSQIPTIHEGYVARKRVQSGQQSERVDFNSEIKKQNVLLENISAKLQIIDEVKVAQEEYAKAEKRLNDFKKCAKAVQNASKALRHSLNPFRWKKLAETIDDAEKKLKKSAKALETLLGITLFYESHSLDCRNAPENHVNEIIARAERRLKEIEQQAKKSAEKALKRLKTDIEDSNEEKKLPDVDKPLFSLEIIKSDRFRPTSQREKSENTDLERKKKNFSL